MSLSLGNVPVSMRGACATKRPRGRGESDKDPADLATRVGGRRGTLAGMEKRVALLVVDGFTDSGLSVAVDVLRAANALAARDGKPPVFRIDVVSPRGGRVR